MSELAEIFSSLPAADHGPLYQAVVRQLQKDFHPYADSVSIPEFLNSDSVKAYSLALLQHLLQEHPTALGAVLYRVDLGEKAARIAASDEQATHALALAILKREAQKVWLRHHLS